jgi:hypothetical protein
VANIADLLRAAIVGGADFGQRREVRQERNAAAQMEAEKAKQASTRELLQQAVLRGQLTQQKKDLGRPQAPVPGTPEDYAMRQQYARIAGQADADQGGIDLKRRLQEIKATAVARPPATPEAVNWQMHTNADGSVIQVDPRTGSTRPVPGATALPGSRPNALDQRTASANRQMIGDIEDVERKLTEYPNAVGWKGYLPDAALQRTDPKGVALRAALANVGSAITLMRSGGAVSDSEFSRLEAFLPKDTDNVDALRVKLSNLKAFFKRKSETGPEGVDDSGGQPPAGSTPTLSDRDREQARTDPQFREWLISQGYSEADWR